MTVWKRPLRKLRDWTRTDDGGLKGPSLSTDDTNTKRVSNTHHYTKQYSGADADARLDNALAAASDGETVILEPATYSDTRTTGSNNAVSNQLTITGSGTRGAQSGTVIDSDWDLEGTQSVLSQVRLTSTVSLLAGFSSLFNCNVTGTAKAKGDRCLFFAVGGGGSITFTSDASKGAAGVLSGDLTTTDNGNNRIL